MGKLTDADSDALRVMPDDWFSPLSLYINRPQYRCERLHVAGVLDTRVIGEYPDLVRQYRKRRPSMAKCISTQIVSNVFVKKTVTMWFVPRRFANQVAPRTKIMFWNSGDYYGRVCRIQYFTEGGEG